MEFFTASTHDYLEDQQGYFRMSKESRIDLVKSAIAKGRTSLPEYMKSEYIEIAEPENNHSAIDLKNEITLRYGEDTATAFTMYTKLDSIDQGEIRGEMKHMLKASKYSVKEESKNA